LVPFGDIVALRKAGSIDSATKVERSAAGGVDGDGGHRSGAVEECAGNVRVYRAVAVQLGG